VRSFTGSPRRAERGPEGGTDHADTVLTWSPPSPRANVLAPPAMTSGVIYGGPTVCVRLSGKADPDRAACCRKTGLAARCRMTGRAARCGIARGRVP